MAENRAKEGSNEKANKSGCGRIYTGVVGCNGVSELAI
ncbi:hypothetical protein L581_1530 [Serratia fonticola AU-AP2C]|nr:hypothetical protein L581_1530 [Serratia fonticola AU-AP2C]